MKRIICWIVVSTIFALTSSAQEKSGRFSIGISAGVAIPVGTFASMDTSYTPGITGPDAGWAKVGEAVSVSVDYHISDEVGIFLQIGGQQNKKDAAPMRKRLEGDPRNANLRPVVKEGSWRIGKIMLGPIFDIPISNTDKIGLQFAIGAGMCKTAIPSEESALFTEDSNPQPVRGGRSDGISLPLSFCYQGSVGVKYQFTSQVSLVAKINYFGSKTDMKYNYAPTIQDMLHPVVYKKTYSLNTVSPMVGVEYRFR